MILRVIGIVIGVVEILPLWRVGFKGFRGLAIGVVGILSLWRVYTQYLLISRTVLVLRQLRY
jgi:hypothetical protein